MQKKLIALALASAYVAPAFAATSNVDVYGVVNLQVESVDDGQDRKLRVTTGNNSAIGFKGSEDLGGGLKANWQVETNLSIDGDSASTNGAAAGNPNGTRNTYVGLSGGWGEIRAGIHDTPYKMSTGRLDSFVATSGDYNSLFGAADGTDASKLFDIRAGNVIAYISPNMSGFQVAAAYIMSNDTSINTTSDYGNAYSVSATYTNGPLFVTGAYEKHNLECGAGTSGGVVLLNNCDGGSSERDAWKVGASFDIGALTIGALYERMDLEGSVGEHSTWYAKADYKMGNIKLKAAYGKAGEDDSAAGNNDARLWALGADYSLSKRTTLQATYSNLKTDPNGNWLHSQGGNNIPGSNGGGFDSSAFGVGVVHKF